MDIISNPVNNTIWTIGTEFSNCQYQKINSNHLFVNFINKWIEIMLLKDDGFFKLVLVEEDYVEFINKINKYKNTYGDSNYNISLYFSEYNFSEQLADKILTIRNKYGIMLFFLLAFPFDIFTDDLKIFSQELKLIEKQINLKSLLQEVSFDLGCSSYALGKIYDCVNKIYSGKFPSVQDKLSDNNFELYSQQVINQINSMTKLFDEKNNGYTQIEQEQINTIKIKQKSYLPLDFIMSNKVLIYFIKSFFKF